ncbi:MAG: DNA polymerase III subunit gamma/tau [Gammaproteobacteria bacterium]|nr:DNA polymerase III subunit gamma/tau [Gammaproteobacteria bacterium]
MSSSVVLARKWRPKNFAQMVGQDPVVQALTNALTQQRLHHAYLFTGTRGVGKTTVARILAKCLNCETGITATPCGECNACVAINAGRFIDLIEVDAASRTKVEDTRELLDNVQYAPSQGRFKIYLIDEVHMLSGHSFNALLKTLEEPPEHVKFLLATTDPHKLPITVLSRCLQFHLKNMPADIIAKYLADILQQEKIPYEVPALQQLGQAADGSMRDALSLLDQTIALSNSDITNTAVQNLLGQTNTTDLYPLLDSLISNDGTKLLEQIQTLATNGYSFPQVLDDVLALLHQISLAQIVPTASQNSPFAAEKIQHYAQQFSKEDIQLLYQIAIVGRRDLPYAPSPRAGFEVTLLRMLTFVPVTNAPTLPVSLKATQDPVHSPQASEHNSWPTIVQQLNLSGMNAVFANHCVLKNLGNTIIELQIDPKYAALASDTRQANLTAALTSYLGRTIKLKIINVAGIDGTPAAQQQRAVDEKFSATKTQLVEDPLVKNIMDHFGATIDDQSIKSIPIKSI